MSAGNGKKKVLWIKGVRVKIGKDSTLATFKRNKQKHCLLDPALANPLIDAESAEYYAGFSKIILMPDGNYSLRVPVVIKRALVSKKSQESRNVEIKSRFHKQLPGITHLLSLTMPLESLLPQSLVPLSSAPPSAAPHSNARGSSSGLSAADRAAIPAPQSPIISPPPFEPFEPEPNIPGGKKGQTKRDYSKWYDEYEKETDSSTPPTLSIAD
jgi:hypothetical protein